MKLLFDRNLPHRITARLADLFECVNVPDRGLQRETSDDTIREFAKHNRFIIVTSDRVFAQLAQSHAHRLSAIIEKRSFLDGRPERAASSALRAR